MTKYKTIIDVLDTFNFDVIEEYRSATLEIKQNSGMLMIFKKKNYDGIISHLNDVRETANSIDLIDVKIDTNLEKELLNQLTTALHNFKNLCNTQIQLQMFFKKKAEGGKNTKFSSASELAFKINEINRQFQSELRALDVLYADYLEGKE